MKSSMGATLSVKMAFSSKRRDFSRIILDKINFVLLVDYKKTKKLFRRGSFFRSFLFGLQILYDIFQPVQ